MIRINLLPAYVLEQEKVRKFASIFGMAVVIVIVGVLLWYKTLSDAHAELQVQLQEVQATERIVRGYQSEAQAARQESQGIQAKVKFIKDLMEYNKLVPRLYEEMARYTYKNILYTKVNVSSTALTIEAYTRSVGDAGKYLLNMYKATDLFTDVNISAVPGYPAAVATEVAGAIGTTGYQGFTEAAGMPMPYAPITNPLSQAFPTAESQQNIEQTPFGFALPSLGRQSLKRRPTGFMFTVTCTLRRPINPPMYGPQAAAPGAVGAPGMAPAPSGAAAYPASDPEGGRMGGPGGRQAEGL